MALFKQALKIFDFNFTKPIPETQEKNSLFPTDEGIAHAIAFWFELKLNPKIMLSTSPLEKNTHWQQAVYRITPPLALIPQKTNFLVATRNQSSFFQTAISKKFRTEHRSLVPDLL